MPTATKGPRSGTCWVRRGFPLVDVSEPRSAWVMIGPPVGQFKRTGCAEVGGGAIASVE